MTQTKIKENYSNRQVGRLVDQVILIHFLGKNSKKLTKNSEIFSESQNNPTYHGSDWVEIFKTQPEKFEKLITKRLPIGLRRRCSAKIKFASIKTIEISFIPKDRKSGMGKTSHI